MAPLYYTGQAVNAVRCQNDSIAQGRMYVEAVVGIVTTVL
jgi:hypothetical protein